MLLGVECDTGDFAEVHIGRQLQKTRDGFKREFRGVVCANAAVEKTTPSREPSQIDFLALSLMASSVGVRYRPEVASAVEAVDLCARPNALFPSTGRAQDHGTARGCKTTKVPRLDGKPGAVKSSDLRNHLLTVEALNQHAIGRREHYSAIDSGAAVDVDGFGRLADDRDEQRLAKKTSVHRRANAKTSPHRCTAWKAGESM